MRFKFASLFLTVGILSSPSFAASSLTILTESYPPFNMSNPQTGQITGLATDIVKELMRRDGEMYSLVMAPWSRGMHVTRLQRDTCVFSTARTPAREALYKWVGPLVGNDLVIFGRADDRFRPMNLEDLRHKVIGTKREDASSEFFSSIGYSTDTVTFDDENPRKLMAHRFDYWATGELLGLEIIRQQGLQDAIVPFFVFEHVDMYMACNSSIDQAKIDRWNQILKVMGQDGSKATIMHKY